MGDWATVTTMIGADGQVQTTASPGPRGQAVEPSNLGFELKSLSDLLAAGSISQEEFEVCKQAVIAAYSRGDTGPPPAEQPAQLQWSVGQGADGAAAVAPAADAGACVSGPVGDMGDQPHLSQPSGGRPSVATPPVSPDERVWASDEPARRRSSGAPPQPVAVAQWAVPAAPPVQLSLDELRRQKDEAVAAEDYAEAKRLKELITAEEERLAHIPPQDEIVSRLRRGLFHCAEGPELSALAAWLHESSPDALYDILAEVLPFMRRAHIAQNWQSVVAVFQQHAARADADLRAIAAADTGAAAEAEACADGGPAGSQQGAGGGAEEGLIPDDPLAQIKGVIDFIDQPLSPKTLRDVRYIRRSCSPRRGVGASPGGASL